MDHLNTFQAPKILRTMMTNADIKSAFCFIGVPAVKIEIKKIPKSKTSSMSYRSCLLYTSDAADDMQ